MRCRLPILLLVLAAAGNAARADDAILVLDASGSMWGQIDGKTKVEIARSVMDGLLRDLPPDRRLGLVAYGHRREADCSDIEQVVPVGTDRAAIRAAVNGMSFKGRTPLSAAVQFAAEQLGYQKQKSTVILVSDGVETCNVDPCALGRTLEAAGVDFTAHVIGFGLASASESAGLQCLAEATGGKYIGARTAGDLAAALTETVAAAPVAAPAAATVVLRATELDGGPEITTGLVWTVRAPGGAAVLERSNAGRVESEVPPGDYEVTVVRSADGLTGTARAEVRAGAERTVTIPLVFELAAAVTVTPAAAAAVGSTVSVQWTGPNRQGDYVTVVKAGASVGEYLDYEDTRVGNPVSIQMPVEPGDYEIRYVLGRPQRVLATVPFKATPVEAAVTAPASGVEGSSITISWTAPNNRGDWLTVVKPDAAPSSYNDYIDADSSSDRALDLPLGPGDYELRYVQGGQKIIARAPIAITAASAAIEGPATVAPGASFEISWTGPNNGGDWLTIIGPDAAASAYGSYVDANRGSPKTLQAPAAAGNYELRYVLKGRNIIARRPITVR